MLIEGQLQVSIDGINPGVDQHSTVDAFSTRDPQRLLI